ncbi:hypothetical protein ABPG72_010036 [Tetrahymena utriculariae]
MESQILQEDQGNTLQQHPFRSQNQDIKLFTFLIESAITNRYYLLIGLFAHYGVVSLYFTLAQVKNDSKLNEKNKSHAKKKFKITIIGLYWWFLASIFQFESFFWILWLILIAKTLQNYDYLIKYLDIFSCGNIGFFVYAIQSMLNMSGIEIFVPSICILFFIGLFKTIMLRLERTTFISRVCFGFSVGYITALVLHKLQGQYWKELEDGYLISLLVIGFLAHIVLISYSKEDGKLQTEEEKKKNQ